MSGRISVDLFLLLIVLPIIQQLVLHYGEAVWDFIALDIFFLYTFIVLFGVAFKRRKERQPGDPFYYIDFFVCTIDYFMLCFLDIYFCKLTGIQFTKEAAQTDFWYLSHETIFLNFKNMVIIFCFMHAFPDFSRNEVFNKFLGLICSMYRATINTSYMVRKDFMTLEYIKTAREDPEFKINSSQFPFQRLLLLNIFEG